MCLHSLIPSQILVERAAAAAGRPYGPPSAATRAQKIADARAWSEKYGGNIIGQLKVGVQGAVLLLMLHCSIARDVIHDLHVQAMGVGADWTRVKFTLDPSVCTAVTRLFVRLHRYA